MGSDAPEIEVRKETLADLREGMAPGQTLDDRIGELIDATAASCENIVDE